MTKQLSKAIAVHLDLEGRLIGVEISRASKQYDPAVLHRIDMRNRLLTVAEAAVQSELGVETIKKLLQAGKLRGVKHGRYWIIDQADILAHLQSGGPQNRERAWRMEGRMAKLADRFASAAEQESEV